MGTAILNLRGPVNLKITEHIFNLWCQFLSFYEHLTFEIPIVVTMKLVLWDVPCSGITSPKAIIFNSEVCIKYLLWTFSSKQTLYVKVVNVHSLINYSHNKIHNWNDVKIIFYTQFVITPTCFGLSWSSSRGYLTSVQHI